MASVTSWQRRLYPLLAPLGKVYALAMRLRRRWLGPRGMMLACPCVSVGNIAWGGTGKTPLVEWLMQWSRDRQIKSVVLSRGYKAKFVQPPLLVTSQHTAAEVGDEPLMLALSVPCVPVLVDPRRRRSAAYALEHLEPELCMLDDGFQHLAIRRDMDLVLLRPEDLTRDWNRVIPSGPWREPSSALKWAGAFLIRLAPDAVQSHERHIIHRLARYRKPVFSFHIEPERLRRAGSEEIMEREQALHTPYTLVTGIGEPEQARLGIAAFMGREPERFVARPDHHAFTEQEMRELAGNGRLIVCTAKDAVKMRAFPDLDVWYTQTRLRFGASWWAACSFPEWWEEWYQSEARYIGT